MRRNSPVLPRRRIATHSEPVDLNLQMASLSLEEFEDLSESNPSKQKKSRGRKSVAEKPYRKTIPKKIRREIWDKYSNSKGAIVGVCFCCHKPLDYDQVEMGHVIAHSQGGPDTVDNLRPICRGCNSSMSDTHMETYMKQYYGRNLRGEYLNANTKNGCVIS